jgi:hypothetical protein
VNNRPWMIAIVPFFVDFLEILTPKYQLFDHLLQVFLSISGGILVFVIFWQVPYVVTA